MTVLPPPTLGRFVLYDAAAFVVVVVLGMYSSLSLFSHVQFIPRTNLSNTDSPVPEAETKQEEGTQKIERHLL